MKISTAEDQIKLYLRVIGDDATFQYKKCIKIASRTMLELFDTSTDQGVSEGFVKKDRIQNSPKSNKEALPQPIILSEPKQYSFTFDHIFYEDESLEAINNYINIDISYNNCLISLGKSDIFTSKQGFIIKTILYALSSEYKIEIGCASLNSDKIISLTEGYKEVKDIQEAASLLFTLDYFMPRKSRDEINVTTLILSKENEKNYLQFADVHQCGKGIDTLSKVLTNSIFSRDGPIQAKDALVQTLTKSICFGGKIIIIGNIFPTSPYIFQSRSILLYIDNIQKNRYRNRNAYTDLLLKEVRKLQKNNIKYSKKNDELSTQMMLMKDQLYTQILLVENKPAHESSNKKSPKIENQGFFAELDAKYTIKESELLEANNDINQLKKALAVLETEKKD